MGDVVNLADHRDFLEFIDVDGHMKLIPLNALEDVVDGKRCITSIEGWEKILPVLVDDALTYIFNYQEE